MPRAARIALAVVLPAAFLAAMLALMSSMHRQIKDTIWCYYTDGISIRADAADVAVRPVLWEDPYQAYGEFNVASGLRQPTFAADDVWMILCDGPSTNLDLFASRWSGRSWEQPTALSSINTPAAETSPALARNGRFLYFSSDRAGGRGGHDIWVAAWNGHEWGAATNMGPAVNSPHDELGPAPAPDGTALYFSSDRPSADAPRRSKQPQHDIYVSHLQPHVQADTNAPPPVSTALPSPEQAVPVATLCSRDADIDPVFTPRGDLLYFASDRKGGRGGLDIYRARVLDGVVQEPENLGIEINTGSDESGPAVRMQGFDLLFDSNRGQTNTAAHVLYKSTSREVIEALDLSRWHRLRALVNRIKWWVALFIASLLLLIYLIRHFRDLTGLFHKCLMGSVIAHLLLLLAMAFWFMSLEFLESMDAVSMNVSIDVDALAKEKLALDMQEQVTELPPSDVSVVVEQADDVPLPEFTPPEAVMTPIVTRSSDQSFVTKVTPSAKSKHTEVPVAKQLAELPPLEMPKLDMPEVDVQLEVREVVRTVEEPPAPPELTASVEPTVVQEQPEVTRLDYGRPLPKPTLKKATSLDVSFKTVTNLFVDADEILKDVGQTLVVASVGRETAGPRPELTGAADLFAPITEQDGLGHAITMATPGTLDVPTGWAAPADGAKQVQRGDFQAVVSLTRGSYSTPRGRPGALTVGAADVVGSPVVKDTGGKHIVPSGGLDTPGGLLKLTGLGDVAKLLAKYPGRGKEFRMFAPGKLDVPASYGDSLSPRLFKNPGRLSIEVVEALGGSAETQASVGRALDWFTKHQEEDGRWDIAKHGGEARHDMAAVGATLLCYYGWGAKHTEQGPHQEAVNKAISWTLTQQKEDGRLYADGVANGMYDHGIATIALSEAYGMTRDPRLLEAVKKAVGFIVKAQDERTGGWRYQPRSGSDTSVFGWHYMALRSAELAGLEVPESVFARADKWLDAVGGGQHGGIYGYQGPDPSRRAMIATGMFCRQLSKLPPTDPRMREGALYMRGHPIVTSNTDCYYLYYGTLALYQHQGEIWDDWNQRMKDTLLASQIKSGLNAGSWNPPGKWHGNRMGRVVTTALNTLSLEVYYRILPIYGFPPEKETKSDEPAAP